MESVVWLTWNAKYGREEVLFLPNPSILAVSTLSVYLNFIFFGDSPNAFWIVSDVPLDDDLESQGAVTDAQLSKDTKSAEI